MTYVCIKTLRGRPWKKRTTNVRGRPEEAEEESEANFRGIDRSRGYRYSVFA